MAPKHSICHGVHGPCPKKKFDTNADSAPTRKPAPGPRHTPVMTTNAPMGFNCGSI